MQNFIKPTPADERAVMEYKNEFLDNKENMAGTSCLNNCENYSEWLEFQEKLKNEKTCPKEFVTSDQYLFFDNNILVGMLNLRHYLNQNLLFTGGHIGYSVRKSQRVRVMQRKCLNQLQKNVKKQGF